MKKALTEDWNYLKGKKVYLVCFAWFIYTLSGVYLHQIDAKTATNTLYQILVIAGFRHGLQTVFSPENILKIITELNNIPSQPVEPEKPIGEVMPVDPISEPTV